MKKLIIKLFVFLLLSGSFIFYILNYYGGRVDSFYYKFTTPKTKSMIIGDSNGLEGIKPSVFDERLKNTDFELPMFNYCFTIAQARIGPLYRKSILKKIDKTATNGLFIIAINPLMLLSDNNNDNYNNEFAESNQPPHNMIYVDVNPNFEYFFRNYKFFHFKALFRNKINLHKNGWLQDNNLPTSNDEYKNRRKTWINSYNAFAINNTPSKYRLKSLDTLIKQLKNYGKVCLVNLPIDNTLYHIEHQIHPKFNNQMDSIALINKINFYNFFKYNNSSKYKTLDGVHLNKYASEKFTNDLCDSIISHLDYKNL